MVLTKEELIGLLQHEVRILLHLCGKVQPEMVEFRPTPKQRSTIELLRYLTIMGRILVPSVKGGVFLREEWGAASAEADAKDLDSVVKALEGLAPFYAESLSAFTDEELRGDVDLFGMGQAMSRGAVLVNLVLGGHAAYRTQLFCYLKSCGRDELNTMNLWAGVDAAM